MNKEKPIKLKVPQQNLQTFSHFELSAEAAHEWAGQLPVANTRQATQHLLVVLEDLNHYPLAAETRASILTALMGSLQVTLANLSKRFLHQPLVMPEEPRQLAELTERLLLQLIQSYCLLAVDIVNDPDQVRETNPAKLLCESIQSGLAFCGRGILLNVQLYRPVALGNWLTLHQLYALAERQGLAALPVVDSKGETHTIAGTYLQNLMLGCIKPNQLRQSDMSAVHSALGQWSAKLDIRVVDNTENDLFLVDLDSDQPPLYSAIFSLQEGSHCRTLCTKALVAHLQQLQARDDAKGKPGVKLDDGTTLPSNMLSHLINCLGQMSLRNFNRTQDRIPMAISVGLGAAHFHASGEKRFEQLLSGNDEDALIATRAARGNPFLDDNKSARDPWRQANPEDFVREKNGSAEEAALTHSIELDSDSLQAINHEEPEPKPAPRHMVYYMESINASPGGYCLEWKGDTPDELRAGAIASVKEQHSSDWSIAVVRWVSRMQSANTMVGLELLSPKAVAYGALVHAKKRQERPEPQRVLLLPEITLVGQPHTLVTARAGFRERQKVSLLREGEKFYIQLTRQIAATGSYAQFDFRYIKQLDEVMAEDKSGPLDASYDSLWSNI